MKVKVNCKRFYKNYNSNKFIKISFKNKCYSWEKAHKNSFNIICINTDNKTILLYTHNTIYISLLYTKINVGSQRTFDIIYS